MRYGAAATNPPEWVAFKLGLVPHPILDVIVAPTQARALIAAERTGLLARLAEGPGSTAELAAACRLDVECTRLVLRVVRAMGYADLRGDRYVLTSLGEAHFGKAARES